jgi:hypothetical protein
VGFSVFSAFVRRGAWRVLPALGASFLISMNAAADNGRSLGPGDQPFRMSFSSTTSCLDPSEFVEEIVRRSSHLRPALSGEHGVTFVVELTDVRAGTQGLLRVQYPDGASGERSVPGADCHEVISAMALIAVLMVEQESPRPEASYRGASSATPPEKRGAEEPEPPPQLGFNFGVGQRARLENGPLPGATLGESLIAEIGYAFDGFWRPSARLTGIRAARAISTETTPALGTAGFSWKAARLSLCPVEWTPLRRLSVRPCVFGEAGSLHAAGYNSPAARNSDVFWSSAGAEIDFEIELLGPLTLGADLGVRTVISPAPGEEYYFKVRQPELTVFTVPSAGFSGGLGLGLRFF